MAQFIFIDLMGKFACLSVYASSEFSLLLNPWSYSSYASVRVCKQTQLAVRM